MQLDINVKVNEVFKGKNWIVIFNKDLKQILDIMWR